MFQDIFSQMNQSIDQLTLDFNAANDIDEELFLLEKYLSIKEMSEDLYKEISNLRLKLKDFEVEHGLLDINIEHDDDAIEHNVVEDSENDEIVVELDESDFLSFQKGIGYYDLFMHDNAILHLENILKKYPDFNLARLYTAMTYYRNKQYNDAKHEVQILFRFSEDNDLISLGHNILGMIYGYEKNIEQAIGHFYQAIELKSSWDEPKYNLAIIYYKHNRYMDAIPLLEELYHKNPKDWEVIFYLGKIYQKINKHELASEFFRQTYMLTKQPSVIHQIARHYEQIHHFKKAELWYKKLIDIDAMNTVALNGIARNLWLDGVKNEGLVVLKKSLFMDKDNIETLLLYAWMLTDLNDKKVFNVMDKLVTLSDDIQTNHFIYIANIARLYYLNKDYDNAEYFCSILLHTDNQRTRSLGHMVQGLNLLEKSKPTEAIHHFEKINNEFLHFTHINFYIGYSYYLLGRLEEAKDYWSKTI